MCRQGANSADWRYWPWAQAQAQAHHSSYTPLYSTGGHFKPGKASSDRVVCWLVVSRSNMYSPRLCHTSIAPEISTATGSPFQCQRLFPNAPNRRGSFRPHVDRSISRPRRWGTMIGMPGKTVSGQLLSAHLSASAVPWAENLLSIPVCRA